MPTTALLKLGVVTCLGCFGKVWARLLVHGGDVYEHVLDVSGAIAEFVLRFLGLVSKEKVLGQLEKPNGQNVKTD